MTKDVQKQTTFDEIYFTDRENEPGNLLASSLCPWRKPFSVFKESCL